MSHIEHNKDIVKPGEGFEPRPGYRVVSARDEGLRVILRDAFGEFARPVSLNTAPRENRALLLGERRTLIMPVPDHRPIVGETIYTVTHQVCVPGTWEDVKGCRVRSTHGHAGAYTNNAGIEDSKLRSAADTLWHSCNKFIDDSPLAALLALKLRVLLQEGDGEPGGWDDPALTTRMAELLDKAGIA